MIKKDLKPGDRVRYNGIYGLSDINIGDIVKVNAYGEIAHNGWSGGTAFGSRKDSYSKNWIATWDLVEVRKLNLPDWF
jgi:hypothetical protein